MRKRSQSSTNFSLPVAAVYEAFQLLSGACKQAACLTIIVMAGLLGTGTVAAQTSPAADQQSPKAAAPNSTGLRPEQVMREMGHGEGRLSPGDPAPDFQLNYLHSKESIRLSQFKGKKPVALVFGSYT